MLCRYKKINIYSIYPRARPLQIVVKIATPPFTAVGVVREKKLIDLIVKIKEGGHFIQCLPIYYYTKDE